MKRNIKKQNEYDDDNANDHVYSMIKICRVDGKIIHQDTYQNILINNKE